MFGYMIQAFKKGVQSFFPKVSKHAFEPQEASAAISPKEQAKEWVDEVEIPDNLLDRISLQPLDQPVVTPYGHIYSKDGIEKALIGRRHQICPLTGQHLTTSMLSKAPDKIIHIINEFYRLRTQTITALTQTPAKKNDYITAYQTALTRLDREMGQARENLIVQTTINAIKNRLQINSANNAHRAFWETKGKAGKNIPDHVQKVMHAAAQSYTTVESFTKAIDAARQISFWSSFFKACSRAPETKMLYETKNLHTLTIR